MIAKNQKFISIRFKNVLAILAMLGLILGFFPSRADADNNPNWFNGAGLWYTVESTPSSPGWTDPPGIPGPNDTAHILGGPVTLGGGGANVGAIDVVGGHGAATLIINGESLLNTQGGNDGGSLVVVENGGTLTVTGSSGNNDSTLIVNISNGTDGIFEIEDGTATISNNGNIIAFNGATLGSSSILNVESGGMLIVPSLMASSASASVNFNNATLSVLQSHASTPLISGFSSSQLTILSGGLTIDSSGYGGLNGEIDSVLGGGGALNITDSVGNGTITLAAPNTYTGATMISSTGTLQLGNGSLPGSVSSATVITDDGTLAFSEPTTTTITNTITGTGSLVQNGPGQVNLSGTVNYTGSTTVNGGMLLLENSGVQVGSGSSSVSIGGGGTLTLDPNTTLTASTITLGSGNNAGTLALAGTITANQIVSSGTGASMLEGQGGTLIASGTQSNFVSAQIDMLAGGGMTLDTTTNGYDVGISGALSNSGSLTVEGSGKLTLTNTNTGYSGTTIIEPGATLQLGNTTGSNTGMGLVAAITNNNGKLVFNEPGETSYTSEISGTGTLTQSGPGTVTLNGMNNSASSTEVNGSSLLIGMGATLTSNVAVNSGGELQGYGTIVGNVTNYAGGIVSPADAIGTLTINGNYTQMADGIYMVQVDNLGNSDLLVVNGTASLNGEILVNAGVNGFLDNYRYTVLTATGTLSGTFSNVDTSGTFNQAFLQTQVFYNRASNPNNVQFEIAYNAPAFMQAAQTPNQQSVANYILTNGSTTAIQSLIASITTDAQFQAAMDQISGATYANQSLMLARTGNGFSSELSNRLSAFPSCDDAETSELPEEEGVESCEKQNQWWFAVHGAQERINAGQASGLNADSGDAALGYECLLGAKTKVGVGGAYNHLSSHATANEMGQTSGDLYQAGFYARYRRGDWLFGAALDAGTTNEMNAQRQIQGANGIVSTGGNYRAWLFSQQARASYDLLVEDAVTVSPFVGVINQQLSRSSFSENGTTGFELNIEGSTYHSTRSQLGALVEVPMDSVVKPFASVDWEYEFGNQNAVFNANVVGVGGQFRVEGQPIGRNMALVKAGVVLLRGNNWNVAASYEGSFGNAWQQNGATLQASMMFG